MTGNAVSISVTGLTKVYRNGTVGVRDLSFDIHRGEIVGLLGPNGSGKTTTINLLTASFAPSAGTGIVLGHDIRRQTHQIRSSISMVPQFESIDWSLTVYQNLRVFADLLRVRGADSRIGELLDILELSGARTSPMEQLSGGQIRRVQLARAMLFDSELVFVDEPTVGLDPVGARTVLTYLQQRAREGKTVVLATNIMSEMERVCDRIIFLNRGRLLFDGTTQDIVERCQLPDRVTIALRRRPSPALLAAMAEIGLEVTATEPLSVRGNNASSGVMKVLARQDEFGVEVDRITVHVPTLEDAFMYIAEQGGWDG